jgi:hypothetical protein
MTLKAMFLSKSSWARIQLIDLSRFNSLLTIPLSPFTNLRDTTINSMRAYSTAALGYSEAKNCCMAQTVL